MENCPVYTACSQSTGSPLIEYWAVDRDAIWWRDPSLTPRSEDVKLVHSSVLQLAWGRLDGCELDVRTHIEEL